MKMSSMCAYLRLPLRSVLLLWKQSDRESCEQKADKKKKGRRSKTLDQINAVDQDGIWNDIQRLDIPTYNPKKLVLTSFLQNVGHM